eukprot:COSAG05_NODE_4204_length_1622_cov_1.551543_2_plen_184_part_01
MNCLTTPGMSCQGLRGTRTRATTTTPSQGTTTTPTRVCTGTPARRPGTRTYRISHPLTLLPSLRAHDHIGTLGHSRASGHTRTYAHTHRSKSCAWPNQNVFSRPVPPLPWRRLPSSALLWAGIRRTRAVAIPRLTPPLLRGRGRWPQRVPWSRTPKPRRYTHIPHTTHTDRHTHREIATQTHTH